MALANILSVEMGTPDGQEISQFLQFEQYSKEGSTSSWDNLILSKAGPTILGPRNLGVAFVTGQWATHTVQAVQLSGLL